MATVQGDQNGTTKNGPRHNKGPSKLASDQAFLWAVLRTQCAPETRAPFRRPRYVFLHPPPDFPLFARRFASLLARCHWPLAAGRNDYALHSYGERLSPGATPCPHRSAQLEVAQLVGIATAGPSMHQLDPPHSATNPLTSSTIAVIDPVALVSM